MSLSTESSAALLSFTYPSLNGCNFTWQTQPSIPGVKGEGNLPVTADYFSVAYNFQNFSSLLPSLI